MTETSLSPEELELPSASIPWSEAANRISTYALKLGKHNGKELHSNDSKHAWIGDVDGCQVGAMVEVRNCHTGRWCSMISRTLTLSNDSCFLSVLPLLQRGHLSVLRTWGVALALAQALSPQGWLPFPPRLICSLRLLLVSGLSHSA